MADPFDVDNPVFVMGTGRCGLSPVMDLISYHPAFAWPSQFNEKFPQYEITSILSRVVDLPIINHPRLRTRFFPPHHTEAFSFYNLQFHGFAQPYRDLIADDVSKFVATKFRDAFFRIMKYQGKPKFIAEYSGWSRMTFLKKIFPGAKFIHVVRDGRAVANSLTNVYWWLGWEGVYKWRWGVPNGELLQRIEQYDHSFLALAAIHWKILIQNIVQQSQLLPAQDVLIVRYEDMVEDPHHEAYRCIEFCKLDKNHPRFVRQLSQVKIVNANTQQFRIPAWRANMTDKQIRMLDDLLEEELILFKYLDQGSTEDAVVDESI
ncbi:MAG: sulfotransferase family protein [Candidatus Hermodarchaeia archaeon]|jgi:hypothetical protein